MEAVKLFISVPFRLDGTKEKYPDCIFSFKAQELRKFMTAIEAEIPSCAVDTDDCLVTEIEFGTGSYCSIGQDDTERLYKLIKKSFHVSPDVRVTLNATASGFNFFRLTAAKHLNEAFIRFETPTLDGNELERAGFSAKSADILAALNECRNTGYHRFICSVSPEYNPSAEILENTLSLLISTKPLCIDFSSAAEKWQRELADKLLTEAGYAYDNCAWYSSPVAALPRPAVQFGCGPAAVSRFGENALKSTSDFEFWCEHSTEFDLITSQ